MSTENISLNSLQIKYVKNNRVKKSLEDIWSKNFHENNSKNNDRKSDIFKIYKITSIQTKKTKRNDVVYSFQLNNDICIENINPDFIWKSSGKKNIGKSNLINKFWIENNYNLDGLKGKYIFASLSNSEFGIKFGEVRSIDIIGDFQEELGLNNGMAFYTKLPIYKFLEYANYDKNNDGSINLKNSNKLRIKKINSQTLCYPYSELNDILSLENIDVIFHKFYSHLNGGYEDGQFEHRLSSLEILKYVRRVKCSNKMTTSGDCDYWSSTVVLRIGNKLNNEQRLFLSSLSKNN